MLFFGLAEVIQPDAVFLTDCGTVYRADCLTLLLQELYNKSDTLAGVTARQRVMNRKKSQEVSENSLVWTAEQEVKCSTKILVRACNSDDPECCANLLHLL